jgi:Domain of unknown function (DUF3854)
MANLANGFSERGELMGGRGSYGGGSRPNDGLKLFEGDPRQQLADFITSLRKGNSEQPLPTETHQQVQPNSGYKPLVWLRTTRNNSCPCCGKYGWCEISDDGAKAHCMHSPNGGVRTEHRGGGRIFDLRSEQRVNPAYLPKRKPLFEKLDKLTLDRINRAFLAMCPLKPEHKEYLEKEGVPTNNIGSLTYCEAVTIAKTLVKRFGEETAARHPLLRKFASKDGSKQFWGLAVKSGGILFPAVNKDGQILGIQIRQDNPLDNSHRYYWLSSEGKGGTPLSVFKGNENSPKTDTLVITEGYKKAAAINQHWGSPAISVAGVGAYNKDELIATVQALRAKQVVIAFDQDKRTNQMVQEAEERLLRNLSSALPDVNLKRLEWDEKKGKGLDDAIKAGAELKIQPVGESSTPKSNEDKQNEEWEKLRQLQREAERIKKIRQR